jgi:hypothetical protein
LNLFQVTVIARAVGSRWLWKLKERHANPRCKKFRTLIDERVTAGMEFVFIDIPDQDSPHTWLPYAGMFRGDPLIEEWKEAMAENRRQADADHDGQDDS